jgi:RNA polymerase sigma-70 factor (ECF subfamily)
MRAYQDMVFTTSARLVGDDRQAEDIAQEVFLKAFENFDQLRTSPSAGGWLKTVARNLSLNHIYRYRRRWRMFSELRREDSEEDEPEVEFALPDDVLAGVDADVRHGLVEEALHRLPERQRLPLVLYHFEELSYDEIAGQLGVSLAKVKTDIFRARAALAKLLAQRGVTAATSLGAP